MSAAPTHKLLSPLSIAESKSNPRRHFDGAAIAELAESIRKMGVLEPILVRPKGDEYELVSGHRRLRAAKEAGAEMIPAMVHELNDTEVLEVQLEENTKRADLHPLEEAAGYVALLQKKHGYNVARIAERTGKSVKYIYDRVKLLELTKEAQRLFLEDRITAGHAILLARLSPKDQEQAIDPQVNRGYGSHGIWQGEHALFDPDDDESKDKYHGLKAVSVREFEAWVDRSIRFDRKLIEPVLYPDTARLTQDAEGVGQKIVPITYDHGLSPDLKGDERTVCVQSWKRADGRDGSKPCEHQVLGVIVVGRDRGQAFDVCIAKEKCKTHWAGEAAAKKRAAKQREQGGDKPTKQKDPQPWKIEEEKRQARAEAWRLVTPAILEAFCAAIVDASTAAAGPRARVVLSEIHGRRDAGKVADEMMPLGKTAEDFIRHAAFSIIADAACDEWNAEREIEPLAKALGVDIKAVIKRNTPAPAKAKKGAKTKPTTGTCRECGCTDDNCEQCIEATGEPCTWVEPDLCSACAPANVPKAKKPKRKGRAA